MVKRKTRVNSSIREIEAHNNILVVFVLEGA